MVTVIVSLLLKWDPFIITISPTFPLIGVSEILGLKGDANALCPVNKKTSMDKKTIEKYFFIYFSKITKM